MTSLRREVLGGYRRLLRARLVAFKGDSTMLAASKQQLRLEFDNNKEIVNPKKIAGLIKGIDEVEGMLLHNIAQGRLNDRGNYAVNVAPRSQEPATKKDGVIEVEHIDGKVGNLPEDVTVSRSPSKPSP
ncbi:unnamed protein product [Ascophyllum nodosum]